MSNPELVYSRTDDDWNNFSLDEVLTLLQDDEQLLVGTVIYSCVPLRPGHGDFFDANAVIEAAYDSACSEFGEHAEYYLNKVTEESKAILQTMLEGWADRHAADPTFYRCKNVQAVTVTQGMIDDFLRPLQAPLEGN